MGSAASGISLPLLECIRNINVLTPPDAVLNPTGEIQMFWWIHSFLRISYWFFPDHFAAVFTGLLLLCREMSGFCVCVCEYELALVINALIPQLACIFHITGNYSNPKVHIDSIDGRIETIENRILWVVCVCAFVCVCKWMHSWNLWIRISSMKMIYYKCTGEQIASVCNIAFYWSLILYSRAYEAYYNHYT